MKRSPRAATCFPPWVDPTNVISNGQTLKRSVSERQSKATARGVGQQPSLTSHPYLLGSVTTGLPPRSGHIELSDGIEWPMAQESMSQRTKIIRFHLACKTTQEQMQGSSEA